LEAPVKGFVKLTIEDLRKIQAGASDSKGKPKPKYGVQPLYGVKYGVYPLYGIAP
jgi:hypothetical protein